MSGVSPLLPGSYLSSSPAAPKAAPNGLRPEAREGSLPRPDFPVAPPLPRASPGRRLPEAGGVARAPVPHLAAARLLARLGAAGGLRGGRRRRRRRLQQIRQAGSARQGRALLMAQVRLGAPTPCALLWGRGAPLPSRLVARKNRKNQAGVRSAALRGPPRARPRRHCPCPPPDAGSSKAGPGRRRTRRPPGAPSCAPGSPSTSRLLLRLLRRRLRALRLHLLPGPRGGGGRSSRSRERPAASGPRGGRWPGSRAASSSRTCRGGGVRKVWSSAPRSSRPPGPPRPRPGSLWLQKLPAPERARPAAPGTAPRALGAAPGGGASAGRQLGARTPGGRRTALRPARPAAPRERPGPGSGSGSGSGSRGWGRGPAAPRELPAAPHVALVGPAGLRTPTATREPARSPAPPTAAPARPRGDLELSGPDFIPSALLLLFLGTGWGGLLCVRVYGVPEAAPGPGSP
eukprot:XP_022273027.1 uncharacterized protein LOC102153373 [Canis lupus familiaris]